MKNLYCQNCGTQNNAGSQFCCNCAAPLSHEIILTNTRTREKLFSAHLLNIISAVVLALSIILIAYGVSTSNGNITSTTQAGGTTNTTTTQMQFDISGAPFAYKVCGIDVVIIFLGFLVYGNKNDSVKKGLAVLYMLGACLMTCLLFFGGVKTLSFTCGLSFIMTVAGLLQIIAGVKFLSAIKHD